MARKDSFFVTGGPVGRNSRSYVERQADTDLYNALREGTFCYVLTPRQMGKSSLVVRTGARLRAEGFAVAVVDLTIIGQSAGAEQWYRSILRNIGEQLKLEDEVLAFWRAHTEVGALDRLMQAIQKVILRRIETPLAVFIDEVDYVRSMSFSTGEFFAAIRALYTKRATDESLEKLTFCLLGVASLSDLIEDRETTPFNIGEQIELTDFKEQEAAPLIQGLGYEGGVGTAMLKRVLHWTGGHPYLTQRLCQAVADDPAVEGVDDVDGVCRSLFLSNNARISDKNLVFVRDSILESKADRASLLELYGRVHSQTLFVKRLGGAVSGRAARVYGFLRGYTQVRDDETNPLVTVLRLSGITRVVGDELSVRNRVYYTVFDRRWINANMPDQEKARQRAAFIRGALRIGAVAAAVLLVVTAFAVLAYMGQQAAERERTLTAEAYRVAEARKIEAENQKRIADAKAIEANSLRGRAEAEAKRADDARKEAEEGKLEADRQRQIAETQRGAALTAKAQADAALQEAHRRLETVRNYQNGVDLYFKGEQNNAIAHFKNAIQLYDDQIKHDKSKKEVRNDLSGKAITLTNIGAAYAAAGSYDGAVESYKEAQELYQKNLKDPSGEAYTHLKIGEITLRYTRGRYRDAKAMEALEAEEGMKELRTAKRIYQESGNTSGAAQTLKIIAGAYQSDDVRYGGRATYADIKKAVEVYGEAVKLYDDDGDLTGKIEALDQIIRLFDSVRGAKGDFDRDVYRGYLTQLKEAYKQKEYTDARTRTLIRLIDDANNAKREQDALRELRELLQEYQKDEDFPPARVAGGLIELAKGGNKEQRAEIIKFLDSRLDAYRKTNKYPEQVETLNTLGRIYYTMGDKSQALDSYNKALAVPAQADGEQAMADLYRTTGRIHYSLGDTQKALELYNKAREAYRKAEDFTGETDSLQYIGELYYRTGDMKGALDSFKEVVNLFLKNEEKLMSSDRGLYGYYERNNLYYAARAVGDIYKGMGEDGRRTEFYNSIFSKLLKIYESRPEASERVYDRLAVMSLYLGDKKAFSRYLVEFAKKSDRGSGLNNIPVWLLAANEKEQALELLNWSVSRDAHNPFEPYLGRDVDVILMLAGDEVRERGILDKLYERYKAQIEKEEGEYVSTYVGVFNAIGDRKRANELYLLSEPVSRRTANSNTIYSNTNMSNANRIRTNSNMAINANRPAGNNSTNTSANVSVKP